MMFGQFYNISFHHSQLSGLAEHTNGIIKTQWAKFIEVLKIPGQKHWVSPSKSYISLEILYIYIFRNII